MWEGAAVGENSTSWAAPRHGRELPRFTRAARLGKAGMGGNESWTPRAPRSPRRPPGVASGAGTRSRSFSPPLGADTPLVPPGPPEPSEAPAPPCPRPASGGVWRRVTPRRRGDTPCFARPRGGPPCGCSAAGRDPESTVSPVTSASQRGSPSGPAHGARWGGARGGDPRRGHSVPEGPACVCGRAARRLAAGSPDVRTAVARRAAMRVGGAAAGRMGEWPRTAVATRCWVWPPCTGAPPCGAWSVDRVGSGSWKSAARRHTSSPVTRPRNTLSKRCFSK